jgi:pyruvate dehydrogenase E1 component alpha subunit
VARFDAWLRAHARFTDEEAGALAAAVLADVDEATRLAEESPWPDPATVTDGV